MTEPQTEAETLTETIDRLEAALTSISAHAAPAAKPPQHEPPDPAIIAALDIMIARLRTVLQPHPEG